MGFGSYDESERENQRFDAEEFDDGEPRARSSHDGELRFEYDDASTEDLLDAYEELKER